MNAHDSLPELLPERTALGAYVVNMHMRQGGMASIYLGNHASTNARVAIKVMSSACAEDPTLRARFDRERELMGRMLGIPNVAKLLDHGELEDGRPYLVMEWVAGSDLEDILEQARDRGEPLDVWTATRFALGIARGVEALHQRNVVHRDLKPGNIMLARQGRGDRGEKIAKIVDFGISADLAPSPSHEGLTGGSALGTDAYTSPEQALGNTAHPSMDVWSLGTLLMELYGGARVPSTLRTEGIPAAFKVTGPPEVRLKILEVVRDCLIKDPVARPSAQHIRQALERVQAELDALAARAEASPSAPPKPIAGELVGTDIQASHTGTRIAKIPTSPPRSGQTAPSIVASTLERTAVRPPPLPAPRPFADASLPPERSPPEDPPDDVPFIAVRSGGTQPNVRRRPLDAATPRERDIDPPEEPAIPRALWILGIAVVLTLVALATWDAVDPTDHTPSISEASPAPLEPHDRPTAAPPRRDPPAQFPVPTVVLPEHAAPPDPTPQRTSPLAASTEITPAVPPNDPVVHVRYEPRKDPVRPSADRKPPRVPAHQTPECEQRRARADEAFERGAWTNVLKESNRQKCWASVPAVKLLRLEAMIALGRYDDCIAEGASTSDSSVASRVQTCRDLRDK